MDYRLEITEHFDELLDRLLYYLIFQKRNPDAAKHLLDGISVLYDRLSDNPYQFPVSRDVFLASKNYREARITDMNYLIVFKVENMTIFALGVFHTLENYPDKM